LTLKYVKMALSNADIESMGKDIVPEGSGLERDRNITAQTILDPNNAKDWLKYKQQHSKLDMRGFDTRKQKEPTIKSVIHSITGHTNYIATDPDRFVKAGSVTRKVIDSVADEMKDFKSFKKAIEKAFMKDDSLKHFFENGKWVFENDFKALWETDHIQQIVKKNQRVPLVDYIMTKFDVEPIRAGKILDSMTAVEQAHLLVKLETNKTYQKALKRSSGGVKIMRAERPRPTTPAKIKMENMVRQLTKQGGNRYLRSKPTKWTINEIRIVSNYSHYTSREIRLILERIGKQRSLSSIQTKRFRLRKSGDI